MGKYMRKGNFGAGKVAVMEVSQGALGVRTRAKTLALAQDRKLALARTASLKQKRQTACVESCPTCYLELRSRKLEKVVKEVDRPARGPSTQESLRESRAMVEDRTANRQVSCRLRPTSVSLRVETEEDLNGEVVCSSRTPELSPKRRVDDFDVLRYVPIESELSTPLGTPIQLQLRCSESANAEERFRPAAICTDRSRAGGLDGKWPLMLDVLSRDRLSSRCLEVELPCDHSLKGERGTSSMRKRQFPGSTGNNSSWHLDAQDDGLGSSTRLVADRKDRRMANHQRIIKRAYMRTNLFNDAEAIDELFSSPDYAEREEGKRFTERYNYDVVNDKPLKGRYEWIAAAAADPCSATAITTATLQQQPPQAEQP